MTAAGGQTHFRRPSRSTPHSPCWHWRSCEPTARCRTMIARGRSFLIAEQLDDGSWTETTRPAGNVSYAQRISTTGWGLMALIATADRKMEMKSGDAASKVK